MLRVEQRLQILQLRAMTIDSILVALQALPHCRKVPRRPSLVHRGDLAHLVQRDVKQGQISKKIGAHFREEDSDDDVHLLAEFFALPDLKQSVDEQRDDQYLKRQEHEILNQQKRSLMSPAKDQQRYCQGRRKDQYQHDRYYQIPPKPHIADLAPVWTISTIPTLGSCFA